MTGRLMGMGRAALALALAGAASPALATTWITNGDGNWSVPANWLDGLLPGPSSDVVMDVGGPTVRTVTHDAPFTQVRSIDSKETLRLFRSGGPTTLAVSGAYSNSAQTHLSAGATLRLDGIGSLGALHMDGGTLEGAGFATVAGASSLGGITAHRGTGRTLFLGAVSTAGAGGAIDLDGGRILEFGGGFTSGSADMDWNLDASALAGGGTVRNRAGSVIEDRALLGRIRAGHGGPALFENAGTFRKNAPGATTRIEVPFTNSGTVELLDGNLVVAGPVNGASGTTLSGGRWVVEHTGGKTPGLHFDPSSGISSIVTNAADITLKGFESPSFLTSGGGPIAATLRTNAAGATLRLLGAGIQGSGVFTNDGLVVLGRHEGELAELGGLGTTIVNNGEIRGVGFLVGVVGTGTIRATAEADKRLTIFDMGEWGTEGPKLLVDAGATVAIRHDYFDFMVHNVVGELDLAGSIVNYYNDEWHTYNAAIYVQHDYRNANFGEGSAFNRDANTFDVDIRATGAGYLRVDAAGLRGRQLSLGNRRMGDPGLVPITILHDGGTTTKVRGAVGMMSAPSLSVLGGDSFVIAPNGSHQFHVSTASHNAGQLFQFLRIRSNFFNVGDEDLYIAATIFRPAAPQVESAALPMVVRVGDLVQGEVIVRNVALADGYSEGLVVDVSAGGHLGGVSPDGFIVLAGGNRLVRATLDTSAAGLREGSLLLGFGSGGEGSSGLAPIGIGSERVLLSVMVNNQAAPVFTRFGSALSYSDALGGYVLDLGNILLGDHLDIDGLGLGNLVSGPADDLGGVVSLMSAGRWQMSGPFDVGLLEAGALSGPFDLRFHGDRMGRYLGELGFAGLGTNLSDPLGQERLARLFVKISVTNAAGAVPEPATWMMMILGFGAVGCAARRRQRIAA